ncbi:hypothetical protein EUTSA_v10002186mg [Eutrema salsugineum]|uniref:Large ribosomal subunit protein eL14 domain-containing protein n=1 Tax=Eutrema salsugineum TaxID=72664 RepID=V4M5Y7_EUTSA|nr:hypothetical protein EUTSA_v10002186mg [Eutrema salsugineum]
MEKAVSVADVKNKWEKSSWGRKLIVQQRRAALNDFGTFKIMLAKIKVGILVTTKKHLLKVIINCGGGGDDDIL